MCYKASFKYNMCMIFLRSPEPVEIVIGLEQTRYDVTEDGGLIQICAAILVPADINTLDQSFELDLLFSVESLNATGMYVQPYTFLYT